MSDLKTVPCRGCAKPIAYGTDEKGTAHPLDVRAPVFEVVEGSADQPLQVRRAPHHYVSHFATCRALDRGWRP